MRAAALTLACVALSACASPASRAGEWRSLAAANDWHNVGKAALDPRWRVQDGELALTPGGGDIVDARDLGQGEHQVADRGAIGHGRALGCRSIPTFAVIAPCLASGRLATGATWAKVPSSEQESPWPNPAIVIRLSR